MIRLSIYEAFIFFAHLSELCFTYGSAIVVIVCIDVVVIVVIAVVIVAAFIVLGVVVSRDEERIRPSVRYTFVSSLLEVTLHVGCC